MPARLRVTVSDHLGRAADPGRLSAWLAHVAPRSARGAVNVAIVSDQRIRALNRRYRGKDSATDVLSFTADSDPGRVTHSPRVEGAKVLRKRAAKPQARASTPLFGDIVIARGVARRQAAQAGHPESTEVRILALHGLLHLLGYDHERDDGEMAMVERRLRRKGGLKESLIERS